MMIKRGIQAHRARSALLCRASAAAIMFVGASTAAVAQDAAAQKSGTQPGGIEEITVTATKRSTTLQETPISITAVTGDDLLDRGIGNFTALAQETPGIAIKNNGPAATEYEMRGLSSIGGYSATVGFYLDDVPMTAPGYSFVGKAVIDPNLYDLNRIEVLRGPRGTLCGAGSMGGTIKLLTNQPDATGYHASAETILSGTDGGGFNHGENAMANIPVIDNQLAIRAVVSEATTSGWIDRIVVSPFPVDPGNGATRGNVLAAPVQADYKDVNSEELHGGRISALYTPTALPGLTVQATVFFQRIQTAGEQNYDSNPGIVNGVEAHYEPFDIKEPSTDSFTDWSVTANYKFDSFDVTSVTANWVRSSYLRQDGTEVENFLIHGAPSVYLAQGGFGLSPWSEQDKSRQLTEELRVASSGDGRFQWQGGLFYQKFNSYMNYIGTAPGDVQTAGTNIEYFQFQPQTLDQKAAFGEVSYRILDGLKVTAGGRYYEYKSNIDSIISGAGSATGSANTYSIPYGAQAHGIDPKFNISYEIDKDLMVYSTAERGFRPGGGNQPVISAGPQGEECTANLKANGVNGVPESFGPDNLWSYELGEKYKIGSTLTLDGAVYHERWSGVQNTVSLPCGFNYIANAGTAVVNGGELEAKWFATSNWLVSANFSDSHAVFIENNPQTGTVKGQDMYGIPILTASGALTYFFGINADWQASVRASYDWTDGTTEPPGFTPTNRTAPYGFAGLRATAFSDRWTVAAFVNNLTNKHAELQGGNVYSAAMPAYDRLTVNQPLTAGIDVNVKF